jgi:hypothetical protein
MAGAVIRDTATVIRDTAMGIRDTGTGDTVPMDMVTGLIIRGLDTVTTAGRIIAGHTTGPTATEFTVAAGGRERGSEENI